MKTFLFISMCFLMMVGCVSGPSHESRQIVDCLFLVSEYDEEEKDSPHEVMSEAISEFFSQEERRILSQVLADENVQRAYNEVLHDDSFENRKRLNDLVQRENACSIFAKFGSNEFQQLLMEKNVERIRAMETTKAVEGVK